MARSYTYRAVSGSSDDQFAVNWINAGLKEYSGIALVRTVGDKDVEMFRLNGRATPAEYRSFAEAATNAARVAEQFAVVAEQAESQGAVIKFSAAQKVKIAEKFKAFSAAQRVAMAEVLNINLPEFGYTADGKVAPAVKAPTPPSNGHADPAEAALALVGITA